jgi:tetratricopeptide (TPR) repeat protein
VRRWGAWAGWAVCAMVLFAGPLWAAQPAKGTPPAKAAPKPPAGTAKAAPNDASDGSMVAEAHFDLGLMYHERVFESLDNAIAEYEKAVETKPDYAEAHYHLGLSYHTKGKLGTDDKTLYRKAVAQYKLYLKYAPNGELAEKAKQNIRAVEARLR